VAKSKKDIQFSPVQCKMARAGLGLGIRDLADLALCAPATIVRFEAGESLHHRSIRAIKDALENEGAVFSDDEDGVIIKKED
jgi:predicted transcriptional regulator